MRKIKLLILTLILSVTAFAQINQTAVRNKVAVVDTESFYDEKAGIKKLANAEKQMGILDCFAMERYFSLTQELQKLEKEITLLQCQKITVDDKLKQLQKLKDDSKQSKDEVDACKDIAKLQTVEPVIQKIREKLKEFAKQKGYIIVTEKFSSVLVEGEVDDITSEFIQFCNDYFDKEKLK